MLYALAALTDGYKEKYTSNSRRDDANRYFLSNQRGARYDINKYHKRAPYEYTAKQQSSRSNSNPMSDNMRDH